MNVRTGNGTGRCGSRTPLGVAGCALLLSLAGTASAGPAEQAKRIYERLAGEPPSPAVMMQLANAVCGASTCAPGSPRCHRAIRADGRGHRHRQATAPTFYNVTLKNWVIPWTNRDQTVFAPLNDYAATVIGMVRDNVAFNTVLSADLVYTVNAAGLPASARPTTTTTPPRRATASTCATLAQEATQSAAYGMPSAATAGLITTYGARVGVLHQRHQPRHVPLHDDQPHVQRHADADGYLAADRPHPPGRGALTGRRQPHIPQQLRRLPQRHGSDGTGLRLLQLQWHGRS